MRAVCEGSCKQSVRIEEKFEVTFCFVYTKGFVNRASCLEINDITELQQAELVEQMVSVGAGMSRNSFWVTRPLREV